jgi:hypothetical protein
MMGLLEKVSVEDNNPHIQWVLRALSDSRGYLIYRGLGDFGLLALRTLALVIWSRNKHTRSNTHHSKLLEDYLVET